MNVPNPIFMLFLLILVSTAQVAAPRGMKSVFVKNNDVFVTSDGSEPHQITHDGIPKFLPVWSKDGSKILFNRKVDPRRALTELVVIDEKGSQTNDILVRPPQKAPPEGMRFVETMEWLSNEKVAVGGSVNPSLTETLVLDLNNGREVDDIYDDNGGPVFSPDGLHVAYITGMPHFSPEDKLRPTLNIDHKPVFPNAGTHVAFLTKPQWSTNSTALAIVAEDYDTKKVNLIIWHPEGVSPHRFVDLNPDEQIDLFWNGPILYVKSADRAWRLQDSEVVQVPTDTAVSPSKQAKREDESVEGSMRKAAVTDWDTWCQSCSLAVLPRRRTVNE